LAIVGSGTSRVMDSMQVMAAPYVRWVVALLAAFTPRM
jgi:hypothetical protein